MTVTELVKFLQMPVNFHFRSEPFATLLDLAHVWMFFPISLLLLLPLHGVVLGLMLFHHPWIYTSPPDTLLLLTKLALPAPLLGVDLANMVWQLILPPSCETTPSTPGTGVAVA